MTDRRRGGYQPPERPAPVSNPGSGARTDGGAGSKRQPLRVPAGGAYGERQAAEAQQAAAPLPDNTQTGALVAPSAAPAAPTGPADVFAPTARPNEPIVTGAELASPIALSPQATLRVMYAKFPHPAIARLIDWSANGSRYQ